MTSLESRSRIGRYDVVGRLATGGMAEVLLARLTGASGFERAVAIKLILPQFAEDRAFLDMFLDEARIAARINHPNVARYEELGQADGLLFIVMEYLEGESLASMQRRARSRRVDIPIPVAMLVVAEAAAGLHAAHEMVDIDDVPLGIVHRDISPQNVFVTYQGGIKVLDFGIAKAADRITRTEAGSLKGKFPYMSPEQAAGLPLDRRSDVFSLGIVLYELCTGHRLFRRVTPTATLRAVIEAETPAPSTLVPGFPESVEAICLRALARDPKDRYSSAEELRNALILVMRALAPDTLVEQETRQIMLQLFADRIEEKREMLRRVSAGSNPTLVPPAEVDRDVELPSIDTRLMRPTPERPADTESAPAPARKGAVLWGAVAVAIAALGSLAWVLFQTPTSTERASPVAALEPTPSPAVPDGLAQAREPIETTPDTVTVTIESMPPGADVHVGGEQIPSSTTPTTLVLPRSSETVPVQLRRSGFQDVDIDVLPDVDQRVRYPLVRAPQSGMSGRRPPRMTEPRPADDSTTPPSMDPEPAPAMDPEPFPVF